MNEVFGAVAFGVGLVLSLTSVMVACVSGSALLNFTDQRRSDGRVNVYQTSPIMATTFTASNIFVCCGALAFGLRLMGVTL